MSMISLGRRPWSRVQKQGEPLLYCYSHLQELAAQVVAQMPQPVSISGHTDSQPFRTRVSYDNWDLSTDRANASRRALERGGLPSDRIALVIGKADTEPLLADEPDSPRNRRISIVLLRQATTLAEDAAAAAADESVEEPAPPAADDAPPVTRSAVPAVEAKVVGGTSANRSSGSRASQYSKSESSARTSDCRP